jgi:hypothetical protein
MDFIDHRSTAQFKFLTSATDEKIRINAGGDLLVGISTPFDTSGITLDATGALGVDGHITVATGATYDIGTATNKFRNLYLSGDINVAGASTSGDLTVGGSLSVTTDATVTGSLTVSTDATITNDLTVSNDATITGDLTVSTNAVIAGDLTVNGTTTTINTETLDVKDKNITLNYGGDTISADGAGITIEDAVGAGTDATILWDGSSDTFDFSHAIDVTGTITADNNLTIQNSTAYGSIELGGVSGGFIDIKRPFSDDYDLRLIAEGDGGVINVASGELTIQRAGSAKLATTSTGIDVTGDITVSGTVDGRDVVTDGTKLDTVETNADVTDTVNVTAAGALMDSEVTNLAQVKAFDSADYATAAQGSTADSALQNVVEDTTPQLGGDLASNGNDILFADNDKAVFGAGGDLEIYHDGSASYIKDLGTGPLAINTNGSEIMLTGQSGSEYMVRAIQDGAVELYYDASKKLATTSTGIDVTGTATMDGLTVSGSVAGNYVAAFENTNSTNGFGVLAKTAHTGPSAFAFGAYAASNPLMVVRGDGRVGIGNESPAVKLDIVDTSADVQMRVYKNDGTKNTRLTLTADDSGAKIHYRDADNAGALRFNNNLGEVMRITADTTRVGIGTSSPSYTVSSRDDSAISYPLSLESSTLGTVGNTVGMLFGYAGNTYQKGAVIFESVDSNARGKMHFALDNSAGSGNVQLSDAKMTIDYAGNVGIGTSSPQNLLHVNKSDSLASAAQFTNSTTGATSSDGIFLGLGSGEQGYFWNYEANDLILGTNNTERMRIDSSGQVGIGTDSPTRELEVTGTGNVYAKITAPTANDSAGLELANTAATWLIQNDDTSNEALTFDRAGTEAMRIDSSGRLLVGTTSANYAGVDLAVGSTADSQNGIQIQTSTTGYGYVLFGDGTGASAYVGQITYKHDDNFMAFNTAGSERMRIDSAGNVGIGRVSSSVVRLSVAGSDAGSSNYAFEATNSSAATRFIVRNDGQSQFFKSDNSASMTITNAGNVGIGTSSPSSGLSGSNTNLTISDADGSDIKLTRDTGQSLVVGVTNSNDGYIWGSSLSSLSFRAATSEAMRITSGGNVGIGTSSPTVGKLQVNDSGGAILALTRTSGHASDDLGVIRFGNTDIDSNLANIRGLQDGATNSSALTFETQAAGGATAERMRIDSGGHTSFTLGTDAMGTFLDAVGEIGSGNFALQVTNSAGSALKPLGFRAEDIRFATGSAERMRIDSSGNFNLVSSSSGLIDFNFTDASLNNYARIQGGKSGSGVGDLRFFTYSGGIAERMRLDSSGNLLVGGSSAYAQGATTIANGGILYVSRSGGGPATFRRNSNDGNIITLEKDGATVGSVGVIAGDNLFISGSGTHAGLNFSTQQIAPMAGASDSDGTVSLGVSSARFKDLHLSGTPYIGGTSAGQSVIQMLANPTNGANTIHFGDSASGSDTYAGYINYAHDSNSMQFATNQLERTRIDSSGNQLWGKTAANNTTQGIRFLGSSGFMSIVRSNDTLAIWNRIDGDGTLMEFRTSGTTHGSISISGSTTSYNTTSDKRLKQNIEDADDAGAIMDAIQVRKFDWIDGGEHQRYGMVAQELGTVAPEAVSVSDDAEEMQSVDYSKLVPMMLKEIQSLRARVAQLEGEN